MFRVSRRIGRKRNRASCSPRHGAVVPVLARHIEKCRDDDIGPLLAIGPHQSFDDALLPPAAEGLVAILGETEIVDHIRRSVAEPAYVGIDDTGGLFEFPRANDTKRAQSFRPQRVLPALAACRTGNDDAHAQFHAEIGEKAVLLIIRMRAGMHDGGGGFQRAQLAVQANEPWIGHLPFNALARGKHGRSPPIFSPAPVLRLPGMSPVLV